MTLLAPEWLWLLAGVPGLVVIALVGAWTARRAVAKFFGEAAGRPWARVSGRALGGLSVALMMLAIALTSVALARPADNPTPKPTIRPGRDLVFIIDVSRSMLAQDLKPSRLARAKLAARDVLDVAEGDRIGVLAFAGTAVVKCPLTTDYAFVRMAIDDLSPDSVSRGGTDIGDAIRTAMSQLFEDAGSATAPPRVRTIVLMTDGEDQESHPADAAKEAGARGVRIVTIGLGSEIAGAPVPAPEPVGRAAQFAPARSGVMEYQGKPVESKMDSSVLKAIAEATPGGVFLNVGTGNVELDAVYKRLMRTAAKVENENTTAMKYHELFQWALGAALAVVFAEGLALAMRR